MADTPALCGDHYIPSPDLRYDGGGKGHRYDAERSSLYISKEWAWITGERGGDPTGKTRRCEGDVTIRWSIDQGRCYPRRGARATLSHGQAARRRYGQLEVETNGGMGLNRVRLHQRIMVESVG